MKMKYFRNILLFLTLFIAAPAFAQSIYSIKLSLIDENTSEPVAFATASVTVKGEKTPLKYSLTDDKGKTTLSKLKKGTYIVRAELMGYKTFHKEVLYCQKSTIKTLSSMNYDNPFEYMEQVASLAPYYLP